jgi:hypothetical protein
MRIRSGSELANLILNSKIKLLESGNKKGMKGCREAGNCFVVVMIVLSPKEAWATLKLPRDLVRVYQFTLFFQFCSPFYL